MIRPPAYHFWKFLMKNMIPTNSGLIGEAGGVVGSTPESMGCNIL